MKKLFMVIIGASMLPGFALADVYDSSSSTSVESSSSTSNIGSGSAPDSQSMDEDREQEMREDEIRRDEMRRDEVSKERSSHRYDVDVESLKSDPVSGASAPRYNTDENSGYR